MGSWRMGNTLFKSNKHQQLDETLRHFDLASVRVTWAQLAANITAADRRSSASQLKALIAACDSHRIPLVGSFAESKGDALPGYSKEPVSLVPLLLRLFPQYESRVRGSDGVACLIAHFNHKFEKRSSAGRLTKRVCELLQAIHECTAGVGVYQDKGRFLWTQVTDSSIVSKQMAAKP